MFLSEIPYKHLQRRGCLCSWRRDSSSLVILTDLPHCVLSCSRGVDLSSEYWRSAIFHHASVGHPDRRQQKWPHFRFCNWSLDRLSLWQSVHCIRTPSSPWAASTALSQASPGSCRPGLSGGKSRELTGGIHSSQTSTLSGVPGLSPQRGAGEYSRTGRA